MRSRCSKASWNSTSSSLALRLSWLYMACSASTRVLHSRDRCSLVSHWDGST